MSFEKHLLEQAALHSALTPQDAVKLCHQAAFGAEHLVADREAARMMFEKEYESTPAMAGLLAERISEDYARVSLAAWKHAGRPAEELFQLFLRTAAQPATDGERTLQACFDTVHACAARGLLPFTQAAWQDALTRYRAAGGGPVRHSETYRRQEKPAYRVVRADLLTADAELVP